MRAIRLGMRQVVENELDKQDTNIDTYLRFASSYGRVTIVDTILGFETATYTGVNGALISASCNGHVGVVNRLLQCNVADPVYNDSECIRVASCNGHVQVVEALLQDGRANPLAADCEGLRWAKICHHRDVVEMIEKYKMGSADENFVQR